MAQKTIDIGLRFFDLGNSLKNIASQFAAATEGKNLGKGLTADIAAVEKAASDFQSKLQSQEGKKVSLLDIENLISEGEMVKQRLINLIKETKDYYRNAGISGELGKQLSEVNNSIDNSKRKIDEYNSSIADLGKVSNNTSSQLTKITTIPLGNVFSAKNLDAFISQLDTANNKLTAAMTKEYEENGESSLWIKQSRDLEVLNQVMSEAKKQQSDYNEVVSQKKAIEEEITRLTKLKTEIELKGQNLTAEEIATLNSYNSQLQTQEHNLNNLGREFKEVKQEQEQYNIVSEKTRNSLNNMIARFFSFEQVLRMVRRVIHEGVQAVKDLDKSFTEIAMVTSYTNKEVWKMKDSFLQLAKTTGLTITEVSKLSVEFFRQGRSLSEVIKLTEAAGIAAKLAGISTGDSVRYLTSAVNGYRLSANQAMVVSDKFAALAAASATDYEELATALSKVASQAYSAGVGMDSMLGFIAKALETTREAPENIGTAFKTIFARMQEIKDYGKTLEDGMDVNRVETALNTIGVSLRDQAGEMRNLDEVLMDTGQNWSKLSKNQKAYIATALAGTRQQTRLLAVFEDFDRTMELVNVSSDSLGASYAQQQKYYESIEYSMTQLDTAWQSFVTNIVESDFVIALTDFLTVLVKILDVISGNGFGQFTLLLTGAVYGFQALREMMDKLKIAEFFTKSNKAIKSFLKDGISGIKDFSSGFKEGFKNIKTFKSAQDAANNSTQLSNTLKGINNTLSKQKVVSDVAETGAQVGLKTATDATNTSLAAQIGLLLANPWTWLIVGITAAIGLMVKASYDSYKLNGNLKNLEETTRDYAATAYNANKKASDIGTLLKKYNELAKEINLTAEEEAEMLEYAKQIQDLAGEKQVIDIEGKLNTTAVQEVLEDTSIELNKTVQDAYTNIVDGLEKGIYSYDQLDSISQEYYKLGEAMKIVGAASKEEFDAMSNDVKEYSKTLANARAEARYSKVEYQSQTVGGKDFIIPIMVPLLDEDKLKEVEDKITQSVYNTWNNSNAAEMATMLEDITAGMNEEQIKIINGMLEGADTIVKITNMFGDRASEILSAIGSDLDKVDEIMSTVSSFGLSEGAEKLLTGAIIELGPINGFNSVVKQLGLSFEQTFEIASKLNDLEFENLRTSDLLAGLKGVSERYTELQGMLSGDAEFNIDVLKSAVQENAKLAEGIANNGKLSQNEIKSAIKLQEEEAIRKLELENKGYENSIKIEQAKIAMYQAVLENKQYLESKGLEAIIALNEQGLTVLYQDQVAFERKKTANAIAETKIRLNAQKILQDAEDTGDYITWAEAMAQARDEFYSGIGDALELDLKGLEDFQNASEETWSTAEQYIQAQIDALNDSVTQYKAFITINNTAIDGIKNSTLYFEELTQTVEELAAAMTEVEKALVKLSSTEAALSLLQAQAENLSGEALVQNLNAQIALMDKRLNLLRDTDAAYQRANSRVMDTINANQRFANSVAFEEGRLVTTEQFINLGKEERDLVLDLIEQYNKNADAIVNNQVAIENEMSAIEEANKVKIDMIITTKELIISARKEELDAAIASIEEELDAAKTAAETKVELSNLALDAKIQEVEEFKRLAEEENKLAEERYQTEKDFIDKTKALYQDAFAEEDYTNSLQDLSDKRTEIIRQLAELEGASDLASLKKREELLKQKADLDKEYNSTVKEYNREALLDSLDKQQQELDAAEELRKANYDLVNQSYEDKIQAYQDEQSANEERLNQQELLDEQGNVIREAGTIQSLEREAAARKKLYEDQMSPAALEEFALNLLKDSSDNVLEYITSNTESYANATTEAKEQMIKEWKDYVGQTKEILGELNDNFDTGKYSALVEQLLKSGAVGTGINQLIKNVVDSAPPSGGNPPPPSKYVTGSYIENNGGSYREGNYIIQKRRKVIKWSDGTTTYEDVDPIKTFNYNGPAAPNGLNASGTGFAGCPDPMTPIMVSIDTYKNAGDLTPGDMVYTMHEDTKQFGLFLVNYVIKTVQPKLQFLFDDGSEIIVSESHKFYKDENWIEASNLKVNDCLIGINYNKIIKDINSIGYGEVMKIEIDDAHTYISADLISHNKMVAQYSKGGLATETGLAMLHGTPSAPERVLSPIQTELFDNMISSLQKLATGTSSVEEPISIGTINISTPQLNSNLDFGSAGKTLAAEFKAAINARGLNINKKR